MRKTIPVIRAAALIPLLKLLILRKHPVESILREAGIGYIWIEDPSAPVPVRALEVVAIRAARLEGPDVGCRAVNEHSLRDLAALGSIALGSRTAREALTRIAMAMPYHCSHELLSVTLGDPDSVIHEYWNLPLSPEAQHVFQQFVAAVLQIIVRQAAPDEPVFRRLSILPHPVHGVDHLRPWLTGTIVPSARPLLTMTVPNARLDAPFRQLARDRLAQAQRFPWQRLQDGTMAGSARLLLRAMMHDGPLTVERLSQAADMSVRTLQRRLTEESTSFSDLVEEVRRTAAMEAISTSATPMGDVAATVGYASQSSLTRAVRRWTGQPPIALRGTRVSAAD